MPSTFMSFFKRRHSHCSVVNDFVLFAYWRKGTQASRSHRFQLFSFGVNLLGSRCQLCERKVYLKGYQCFYCGLNGHRKCLKETAIECADCPLIPNPVDTPVFGVSLAKAGEMIPLVVLKCVSELENRGYKNIKWVYEAEGDRDEIEKLIFSFNFAPDLVDLSDVEYYNIGALLKSYLFELKEPLLCRNLRLQFIEIANNFSVSEVNIRKTLMVNLVYEILKLIYKLPSCHRFTLCFLMHHLKRLTTHSKCTELTVSGLAETFAPLLFGSSRRRESRDELATMFDSYSEARIVELLLEHVDILFGPPPPVHCLSLWFNGVATRGRKYTY